MLSVHDLEKGAQSIDLDAYVPKITNMIAQLRLSFEIQCIEYDEIS